MKMNHYKNALPAKQQGFTLIELLVASALSLIIILATTGAYIKTKQLNRDSMQRITLQQELRTTANMLSHVIRNAGSYGCYAYNDNIADNKLKASSVAINGNAKLQSLFFDGLDESSMKNSKYQNVRILKENELTTKLAGLKNKFKDFGNTAIAIQGTVGLDFDPKGQQGIHPDFSVWGTKDKTLIPLMDKKTWVVISDCESAKLLPSIAASSKNDESIAANPECNTGDCSSFKSVTTVRPYYEEVYFFATSLDTGRRGLYRIQMDFDGAGKTYSNAFYNIAKPQLLLDSTGYDSSDMVIDGYYLDGTASDKGCVSKVKNGFTEQSSVLVKNKNNDVTTPVMVEINISLKSGNNSEKDGSLDYQIVATVRGANVCANEPGI